MFCLSVITTEDANAQNSQTIDPYRVPPDTTIPLTLEGFDKKGDVLKLTIIFKGTQSEDFVPRPIDMVILDKIQAQKLQRIELAEPQGIFVRKNVSTRLEEEIVNPYDGLKAIMFFNPGKIGDHDDTSTYENATVVLRVDYTVHDVKKEQGMNILPLVLGILITLIIVAAVSSIIFYLYRRARDAKQFFNPEEGPYYAFKSLLDDRIYYLDPDQYSKLYNSNSLDEYDYLGTATRIGGPITTPDDQPFMAQPMMGQPIQTQSVDQNQLPLDLTALKVTPVETPPMNDPDENYPVDDRDKQEDTTPAMYPEGSYNEQENYPDMENTNPESGQPSDDTDKDTAMDKMID